MCFPNSTSFSLALRIARGSKTILSLQMWTLFTSVSSGVFWFLCFLSSPALKGNSSRFLQSQTQKAVGVCFTLFFYSLILCSVLALTFSISSFPNPGLSRHFHHVGVEYNVPPVLEVWKSSFLKQLVFHPLTDALFSKLSPKHSCRI